MHQCSEHLLQNKIDYSGLAELLTQLIDYLLVCMSEKRLSGDAGGTGEGILRRSVASLIIFCQGEAELSPPE